MRILVIGQCFWPEDFRINELVAELTARGHQITVLTGVPNYPGGSVFPEFARDPDRFASYAGARVLRVPMLTRGTSKVRLVCNYLSYALSASVFGMLWLSGEQFDATFVFEPSPVTVGVPAVFLRAIRGWPIAFWVLDQWPETLSAVNAVRSERVLRAVGRFVRFIYTRCGVVLSPSRLLMPQISSYCGPDQRVEYFPNWVESAYESAYGSATVEPAPEVPRSENTFNIMFAGNIGAAQDFPAILAAAERLRDRRDIRWLIVGDGRMAPWLREEIERRALGATVIMLGRFPADRMPSFFQHADALLVSLRADPVFSMTAPGKIQSYLAVGRPILAMLDGEGAAVVNEAGAGLTGPAGDADRLVDNVLRLVSLSADARSALGANGIAYARREFNRATLVDHLEGWLEEMVRAARADQRMRTG